MPDDSLDEFRQAPSQWLLEQELEVAAEVYGSDPMGLRTPLSDLSDEDIAVHRFDTTFRTDLQR